MSRLRGTVTLTVAVLVLLLDLMSQAQDLATPFTLITRDGRRPVTATLVNNQFVDVTIRLNADNTLDVIHNGTTYFDHVPLDVQGYTPLAGASFLFGARTGGEFEQTVLDNVSIIVNGQATAPPAQAQFTSITKLGDNIVITWTGSGTLQETSSLAPATWTPVAGNPSGSYTTPAATSGNKFYRIATAQ